MTLLVSGADGVRSVGDGGAGHPLDQPRPPHTWSGAPATGEISVRSVRSLGSLASCGTSRSQEQSVLRREAAVLGGDARKSKRSNHRVVDALKVKETLESCKLICSNWKWFFLPALDVSRSGHASKG